MHGSALVSPLMSRKSLRRLSVEVARRKTTCTGFVSRLDLLCLRRGLRSSKILVGVFREGSTGKRARRQSQAHRHQSRNYAQHYRPLTCKISQHSSLISFHQNQSSSGIKNSSPVASTTSFWNTKPLFVMRGSIQPLRL